MAASPIFAATPRHGAVSIATANTARDGTGTLGTLITAGASGSRVDKLRASAAGTTTAGVLRFFIHDGSAFFLWKEILVTAITPSATIEAWSFEYAPPGGLMLPTGYSIRVSTHNAETFKAFAEGGDF